MLPGNQTMYQDLLLCSVTCVQMQPNVTFRELTSVQITKQYVSAHIS